MAYAAYLILNVRDGAYGVEFVPSEVSVTVGRKCREGERIWVVKMRRSVKWRICFIGTGDVMGKAAFGEEGEGICVPWKRDDEEITMNLREVSYQLKGGLVIEGIEKMELLPYDCFAHILSFTSPQDVCRSSLVSSIVQSVADSDAVWEKFLPSNYHQIVSRFVSSSFSCSSKKHLFSMLCNPRPIDDGNKIFSIEKRSGKICYLLSARQLSIAWGNSPLYWSWKPIQGSRFEESAELRTIWWLEIKGSINSGMLSGNTLYGAYLKVKTADRAYGLDLLPSEVSVEVGKHRSQGTVCIHSCRKTNTKTSFPFPCKLEDEEWSEIELGSFYTHYSNEEVRMCLKEVKGAHLKGGLIVDGIEIRPKHLEKASAHGP